MILFPKQIKTRAYHTVRTKMDVERIWSSGTITANVQNPSGTEITAIAEGSFTEGSLIVYSNVQLSIRNEDTQSTSTFVEVKLNQWAEVVAELLYENYGVLSPLAHYKYIAEPRNLKEVGLA